MLKDSPRWCEDGILSGYYSEGSDHEFEFVSVIVVAWYDIQIPDISKWSKEADFDRPATGQISSD